MIAINSAVMKTFCSGSRRPSANNVVAAANTGNRPSVQRHPGPGLMRRQIKARFTTHTIRKRMKTGLCQRSTDREGLAAKVVVGTAEGTVIAALGLRNPATAAK